MGEPVAGYTARYAAPELASGGASLAATSMDIFSCGLVFLEMARGSPLLPRDTEDAKAKQVLGGDGVEQLLADKIKPLASTPALHGMLKSMVEVEPAARKDATSLLQSSVFTGQMTMTGIRAATGAVMQKMDESEARLSHLIKSESAAVRDALRSLGENLQPLRSTVGQKLLELKCLGDAATPEETASAQAKVKEMLDGMMKAEMEGQVKQQVKALSALQPAPDADAKQMIEMMSAMMAKMDAMSGELAEVRSDVKELNEKVSKSLALIDTKLNQLLTGSHEQPFKYFILVPMPTKGALANFKKWCNPKNWLSKPMLLQPLYRATDGRMLIAPGLAKMDAPGFEVAQPREFVKKHPLMVQMGMLALKVALKVGASQIGVSVPAASLDAMLGNMSESMSGLLEMALEETEEMMETIADDSVKKIMSDSGDNSEAALAMMESPETTLIALTDNEEYNKLGRDQYLAFKTWLDEKHPGWQSKVGLKPHVHPTTGEVEWLP